MMAFKPRTLVLGRSFVRRVAKFIDFHQANDNYRRDHNLSEVCDVKIFGVGGCTVHKMIRLDLKVIKRNAPNVVVLELGSNDICDCHCDADSIALSLVSFTELLIKSLSARFVVVCQILPRRGTLHLMAKMSGSKRSTRFSGKHFRIFIQLSFGSIVALLIPLRTSMPVMAFV